MIITNIGKYASQAKFLPSKTCLSAWARRFRAVFLFLEVRQASCTLVAGYVSNARKISGAKIA